MRVMPARDAETARVSLFTSYFTSACSPRGMKK